MRRSCLGKANDCETLSPHAVRDFTRLASHRRFDCGTMKVSPLDGLSLASPSLFMCIRVITNFSLMHSDWALFFSHAKEDQPRQYWDFNSEICSKSGSEPYLVSAVRIQRRPEICFVVLRFNYSDFQRDRVRHKK